MSSQFLKTRLDKKDSKQTYITRNKILQKLEAFKRLEYITI